MIMIAHGVYSMPTGVLVFFVLSSLLSVAISEKIMQFAPSHFFTSQKMLGIGGVGGGG
jgi:hypothetical protein